MQIFNDRKKRIGTLSGFKDRAITTTLDSGDKEMTFVYPASGALVGLLQEEYYIRTKTDEFVIKAVEKGEQFNKYTAVLNVEELEGTAFPYGFESDEQTIRACLEFQTGSYTSRDGQRIYTTDVVIEEQEFAESKKAAGEQGQNAGYTDAGDGFMNIPDGVDEQLPFA